MNHLLIITYAFLQAFILAFTSNFIPRIVYRLTVSKDGSLKDFLKNSLTPYNTTVLGNNSRSTNSEHIDICYYPGYRENAENNKYSNAFWHIFAARLAFVVVFEVINDFYDFYIF